MKQKKGFLHSFTLQGFQENLETARAAKEHYQESVAEMQARGAAVKEVYNEKYKAITGKGLPLLMPRKHGVYRLSRIIVNWNKNTVNIHLHGHKIGLLNTKRAYIEKVILKRLPDMNDHDAIHAAFYVSPRKWKIPMFSPHARYRNATSAPLAARLSAAIKDPNISFSQ
ncbi:hypothetical protein ccbrp13_21320 [Ktedonobacteria bacterium brp13]|nr:hypothetical protein ccbrp13_21320 [Ktedonobacteria bacterium brp13]